MKLTFCGAARTVTGSCHLLTLDDGFQILMDCGLYQGKDEEFEKFNENWYFDPSKVDCLILSHAHIDHSGRIPKLVKDGFKGKIYCTHATRDLAAIMLLDSAIIQVRDAEFLNKKAGRSAHGKVKPLYEAEDAKKSMDHFIGIGYEKKITIHPDVDIIFKDAGHILGSASITLRIRRQGLKDTILGFSGDIGRPDRPILRDPVPIQPCDYVISESTYGDKVHSSKPDERMKLLKIINDTCIKNKGKLIIPAFSVGRTQEIVYMIDQLESQGDLPKVPVYVDSPLSVNATEIFRLHPECYDKNLLEYMIYDPNPFGFNGLHYIKKVEDSKRLNGKEACVIISSSGMITAGRIKHHVFHAIVDPKNTILIVGYCADYTIGAKLRNQQHKTVRIFGEELPIKARVEVMDSFSAHGDKNEMIDFFSRQDKKRIRKMFLVHGDLEKQEAFKNALEESGFDNIVIPELGESINL